MALVLFAGPVAAFAQGLTDEEAGDRLALADTSILDLSLEELMSIDVTTVSGTAESWFSAPAAITVLTPEDVRRSGLRSIPEILRLVPGMYVGRTAAQGWSISPRGFGGIFANRTLVLIDGRSIYDPLFAGVLWDAHDIVLADLNRIEAIRGPGATLWGSNAVNGVINVITKSAEETQGWHLNTLLGTEVRTQVTARYGFELDDDTHGRVYGKYRSYDAHADAMGDDNHDDWSMGQGGFRFDIDGSDDVTITIQGDAYYSGHRGGANRVPVPGAHLLFREVIDDSEFGGANLLGRISKESDTSRWHVQAYWDYVDRHLRNVADFERHTLDIDWQHAFETSDWNEVIWGLGYRVDTDETWPETTYTFRPDDATRETFSAFIQDTVTLVPEELFFMLGTKLEHNEYTEFEFQPGARLWWTPDEDHTLWGSISRAVRVPTRFDTDVTGTLGFVDRAFVTGGPPTGVIIPATVTGNSEISAEELIAYEAGYRIRVTEDVTVDTAIFYNDYDTIIFVNPITVGPLTDEGWGESYGGEISATWRVADNWRLQAAYSYTRALVHGPIGIQDERTTPQHMAQLHSYLDITPDVELNTSLYYVDGLPETDIDSYLRLDMGVTWRPTDWLDLSVWGQNLLDPEHPEANQSQVERGVYFMATANF